MFTSIMILLLIVEHVYSSDNAEGTFCLTTKRVGSTDFIVKPERCATGVEHCLITLSVANQTDHYVRHNFHCWPWPELQSSCPSQPGLCQLLHRSDDQLHLTCCCLGSMCNNASLTYVPLRNESVLSVELRSRLETFGLRDADGQLMPEHLAHLNLSARTSFRDWFESQSTRLVLICLVVLVIGLSIGLIALVHHCPLFHWRPWSSRSPHRSTILGTSRTTHINGTTHHSPPAFVPHRDGFHLLRRRKSRNGQTARHKPSDLVKCCSTQCAWSFCTRSNRSRNANQPIAQATCPSSDLSLNQDWSTQCETHWYHPTQFVSPDRSCKKWSHQPHESQPMSDLVRLCPIQTASVNQRNTLYAQRQPSTSVSLTYEAAALELERMQRVAESCHLLRLLGKGRFAHVWLAKRQDSTSMQLAMNAVNHANCTDPLSSCSKSGDREQNGDLSDEDPQSRSPSVSGSAEVCDNSVAVKIFCAAEQRAWANEFAVLRTLGPDTNRLMSASLSTGYNLIQLIGAGKVQNGYRLVLEFAAHGSLRDVLDRGEWLPFRCVLDLARDTVRGLSYLHADYPTSGKPSIAHRDVKPENILVRADGSACLSDFGQAVVLSSGAVGDEAARSDPTTSATIITATTTLSTNLTSLGTNLDAVPKAGTLRYMAPEILDGAIQFTGRSLLCTDIYSLSLCLWELLSAAALPDSDKMMHSNPDESTNLSAILRTGTVLCEPRRVWLPYEPELGRHGIYPEAIRHLVSVQKHRPHINPTWLDLPSYAHFCRTILESWDSEPEARLSATCVLERLNSIHTQLLKSSIDRTTKSSSRVT